MNIEWKQLKNFEKQYEVSSEGNIRSLVTGKLRKPFVTKKGYLRVSLYKNGKQYNKLIHRLVAKTFIPNQFDKPQINHKDGNKLNNSISNLEWVTSKENAEHAWNIGLYEESAKRLRGETNPSSKLTEKDILRIRNSKKPVSCLANKFSVHIGTIYRVKNRETWKHI